MARPQNALKTIPMTIATTGIQRAYLDELVKTGLYGKSAPDAAERLVSAGLERLVKEGTIRLLRQEGKRTKQSDDR